MLKKKREGDEAEVGTVDSLIDAIQHRRGKKAIVLSNCYMF